MRLHTDILTIDDIRTAAIDAWCAVETYSEHRSRSRRRSFDVFMTGHGKNGGQWGSVRGNTASWDDWGIVLAALYRIDPNLIVGTPGNPTYANAEHFHGVTAGRYRRLTPPDAHHRHRWNIEGPRGDVRWHYMGAEQGEVECYRRACHGTRQHPCDAELFFPVGRLHW